MVNVDGYNFYWIRAGVFLRRHVRRELVRSGLQFTEDRRMLDSSFSITHLSDEEYDALETFTQQFTNAR